jgi:type VI secretion system secreted protein VgrG
VRTSQDSDAEPFACTFAVIDAKTTFRPPFSALKPSVRGPQTAIVVGPGGQEIWTDPYGRVKVQFHWDREGQKDENSSCWVRVAQAWAGSGFGAQFIPRVGQEVIVDFLDGDPHRPIITGSVYNASNMPPYSLPQNQTQSGIKSQSTPWGNARGGNEIRFEDARGREEMYIHAQGTQTTVVERNHSAAIGGDRMLSVSGGETVMIHGGRSTAVALADTLSVVGAATTTVGGNQSLEVTGSAQTSVAGSYALSVEGSVSESVDGDFTRTVSGRVDLTSEGEQTGTFGGDFTERHSGHRTVIVGGPTAKRSSTLHLEGSGRMYAAGTIETVAIEGLTITCGKSQIVIKPDGVTISSPKLTFVTLDAEFAGKTFAVAATDSVAIGGKSVTVSSSGALVALDSNATVRGAKVQLQGGSGSPGPGNAKDPKVTTLTLADEDGKSLANQRVILRTGGEGGPERTIVLDDKGTMDVPGEDPFEIVFLDVADGKKG